MTEALLDLSLVSGYYTAVLIEQDRNIVYLGTSTGCVEIWDLDLKEKITEVRYLIVNDFNEKIQVEEPVVNLAAPTDFSYVYAFMGIAAYCIDTELKTIIQQIPISEPVVSGAVSPILGEISVLTTSGYLSRWSPKFYERIGSIEFSQPVERAFLTHDWDESKIILVFEDNEVILSNLEGERYTVDMNITKSSEMLNSAWFDRNSRYQVFLNEGHISVFDNDSIIEYLDNHSLQNGKVSAEKNLRDLIKKEDQNEDNRNYILDERLTRQSKDRYNAEVESLSKKDAFHTTSNISDDSKTLNFALSDLYEDDIDKKSKALAVIKTVSLRHQVDPLYLRFAWKLKSGPYQLIEDARFYQFEAVKRSRLIKQHLVFSLIMSLFLLLFSQVRGPILVMVPMIAGLSLIQLINLLIWDQRNKNPPIPEVEDFKFMKFISILIVITSFTFIVSNNVVSFIPSS